MPRNPRSTAGALGHSLHALLMPVPVVCFTGTLLTDIAYANTADMQWSNFSAWLLTFGLIGGALALLAGLIDWFGDRAARSIAATVHGVGSVVVMLLALWNVFVHSRDAWTSVMPTGLTLSIVTVVLMAVIGWLGGSLADRRRVGVQG